MITSLALKIGAFSSVGAGGLLAVVSIASPSLFTFGTETKHTSLNTNSKKQIVLKVSNNVTTPTTPTALTSGADNRNYFCRSVQTKNTSPTTLIEDQSCDLVKLTIDATKKWMDLSGVKKTKTTNTLTLTDARSDTNYFRLDTSNELFLSTDLSKSDISIEVFLKDSPQTTLAKFTPLFKVDAGKPVFHKTTHAIARANTAVASVDANSKCTLDKTTTSTAHSCVLTTFGSSVGSITGVGYSNQNFTYAAPTTQATPLVLNQYYLINLNADANGLTQAQLNTTHINFVKITSGNPATQTSQTLLSDVSPVILVGGDSDKKAFILSETLLFSVVVKKTTAITTAKTLIVSGETKNYQCRMSTTIENCTLVPIVFDTNKHLLDVKALKELNGAASVTIQPGNTTKTYYKLEVSDTLFSKLTGPLSGHTIDIVEPLASGQSGTPTTIASFTPFITIGDSDTIVYDKSTYIVHGATLLAGSDSNKTGEFNPSKTHWCSFSTTNTPASDAKKCTLSEFATTGDFSSTTAFSQSLTDTTTPIDTTKLYLIKYTDADDGIAKPTSLTSQIFYFEEGDDKKTKTPIASFSKITPVILVDTAASKKSAFVLK